MKRGVVYGTLIAIGVGGTSWAVYEHNATKLTETTNVVNFVETKKEQAYKTRIKPVVVVFYKNGCPYCKKASGTIISAKNSNKDVSTVFVDVTSEAGKKLKSQFGVTKVPSVASFSNNGTYSVRPAKLITSGSVEDGIRVEKSKLDKIYEVAKND